MPLVPFESLPDSARAWVFASDRELSRSQAAQLLNGVDEFLKEWKAHGSPLTVGRDWRDGRFLTIAVDQSTAGASGCSLDGLYRTLKSLERRVDAALVKGGQVFFRDASGTIQSVTREAFANLAARQAVGSGTVVFDTAVTSLAEWRKGFEREAGQSWHAALLANRHAQPA